MEEQGRYDGPAQDTVLTVGLSILLLTAPQDPPVLGLVRTPGHEPLVDAEVLLRPAAGTQVLALAGLAPATGIARGRTDRTGSYRLLGQTGPGLLLVRHEDGLGALAQVFPGAARRLLAEPMAALVADAGSLRAWLRVTGSGPGRGALPVQEGEEIRLPAGGYQGWIESDGRLQLHRMALVSGQRLRLPAAPRPERFVELWPGFRGRVSPHAWPEVSLIEVGLGRFAVPAGTSRLEAWQEIPGGHAITELWLPIDPAVLRVDEPPRHPVAVSLRTPGDQPLGGAEVWALGSSAQGVQALGRVVTDGRGKAVLLLTMQGEVQLVAVHPHWPASALTLRPEARSVTLRVAPSRPVRVRVEGPSGPGVAGARLVLEPRGGPRLVAHTDGRGLARFEPAPAGPADLRLLDPRFLPAARPVSGDAEVRFRADPGSPVAGRAVLPSGQPAVRALVTLRDPGGGPIAERTLATDARGEFHFTGLSPPGPLVLFASVDVAGVTYSRKLSDVRPGETGAVVELRREDPVPPHRRGRGRD